MSMLKRSNIGSKKKLTITEAPLVYTVLGSPFSALPTSNPASPQVSHTMLSTDRPTFSFVPKSAQYAAVAWIWGKNNDSSAHVAGWHADINGTPIIANGTYSVASGLYYTLQASYGAVSNPDGNVYNFSAWDNDGLGYLDIRGFAIMQFPTKIKLESDKFLYNVTWGDVSKVAPFTGIGGLNPVGADDNYQRFDELTNSIDNAGKGVLSTKKIMYSEPYFFIHGYLDSANLNKVTGLAHASLYPNWRAPVYPHTLTYRVLTTEGKI